MAIDNERLKVELQGRLDGARRMGVSRDVVDAVHQIVLDETALRRRRYELISGPMFLAAPVRRGPGGGVGMVRARPGWHG